MRISSANQSRFERYAGGDYTSWRQIESKTKFHLRFLGRKLMSVELVHLNV